MDGVGRTTTPQADDQLLDSDKQLPGCKGLPAGAHLEGASHRHSRSLHSPDFTKPTIVAFGPRTVLQNPLALIPLDNNSLCISN